MVWMQSVRIAAKRLSVDSGPVNVAAVLTRVDGNPTLPALRLAISTHPDFRWLDDDLEWYMFIEVCTGDHSSVFYACRKCLAVAPNLQVKRLNAAISRHPRIGQMAIPDAVLERYLSLHPVFRVDRGLARLAQEDTPIEDVLGPTELKLVRLLEVMGSFTQGSVIVARAEAAGIREYRTRDLLAKSPVIEHPARGLYGLIGMDGGHQPTLSPAGEDARLTSSWWGPVDLGLLQDRLGDATSLEDLRSAIAADPALMWLDEEATWFWYAEDARAGHQALARLCCRILTVAEELSIEDLHGAVDRDKRKACAGLPRDVFSNYVSQHPAFCCQDDSVSLGDVTFIPDDDMGKNEQGLVDIFREFGPVCERKDVIQLAQKRGLSREMVCNLLGYSPLIERYSRGLYGLVGAEVTATQLWDRAQEVDRRRHRVFQECVATPDGRLWLVYCLSPGMLRSGVAHAPRQLSELAGSDLMYRPMSGEVHGSAVRAAAHHLRVTSNGRIVTGLGTVLGQLGAEPGDWLLLLVDGQLMEAHACIGSEQEIKSLVQDVKAD